MQHQVGYRKLGRPTAHRMAMLRNMVTSLIIEEKIETTLTRAKELRRIAERVVTLAKSGSLAARRRVMTMVNDPRAVRKLFSDMADRYRSRPGGYTRIVRLGFRRGDSAPMSIIEYVSNEEQVDNKRSITSAARRNRRIAGKKKSAEKAAN